MIMIQIHDTTFYFKDRGNLYFVIVFFFFFFFGSITVHLGEWSPMWHFWEKVTI